MAELIAIEHPDFEGADGKPARSAVTEAAFLVAGGYESKGWRRVKKPKAKSATTKTEG